MKSVKFHKKLKKPAWCQRAKRRDELQEVV